MITINRPDQRNAVNAAVAEGIAAALDELDADAGLSIGIITGAGKGFCAGMDLKAFVTGERPWYADRGFAGITQRSADKPLIAAVEGFAVAGGLEVALAVRPDRRRQGREARDPGGQALAGGRRRRAAAAAAVAAAHVALELALTGDPILAERAYELGLVNRLAEPGEALRRRWSWRQRSPPTGRWR